MKQTVILKNKLFLYLTEFFAGMSVMAVELGASRLLAPYFSSSQIVWTIIIGTIMIAMALGNIYGGRSADKSPNPDRLYTRILIAAIWIALIPVVGKYIVLGISALLIFTVSNHFLIIAAFAACMVIFVFPLLCGEGYQIYVILLFHNKAHKTLLLLGLISLSLSVILCL